MPIYHRWAPSLGALEGTAEDTWGTIPYNQEKHIHEPCVFFGLYGLPDFYTLWRHKGKKYILWAGSDITHFKNGYWLDDTGSIRVERRPLAAWINENCESWVENKTEWKALKKMGIISHVCPSFLGDKRSLKITFKPGNNVYLSCSGGLTKEYGFDVVERIAGKVPKINFHLYGADWETRHKNVIVHGRVPKEQMNSETDNFQVGLRLNEFDGFSEILAKAVLRGQYAVSRLPNQYIPHFNDEKSLVDKLKKVIGERKPNLYTRKFYIDWLNKYPWNVKDNA